MIAMQGVGEIPLSLITQGTVPGFRADTDFRSLAASVRTHGVLQAIRVRPVGDGCYEIVAGRRRFAAAVDAGMESIPAVVATPTDREALVESLTENLQRRDLGPLDKAAALRQILEDTGMTQAELGAEIGKSQSYISNLLRLLSTPVEVREAIAAGRLSASHAKAIASLPAEEQVRLAKWVVDDDVPSRVLEAWLQTPVEQRTKTVRPTAPSPADQTPLYRERVASLAVEDGELTGKGQRMALYALLRGEPNYANAFLKRVGGSEASPTDYAPLWDAIEALPLSGVAYEIGRFVAVKTVPLGDDPWSARKDERIRKWFEGDPA